MKRYKSSFKSIYQFSLLSFILAALTGAFFRYGLIFAIPESLSLDNIRHAHTHLMFFNWVSPPVMAWMAAELRKNQPVISVTGYKICIFTMLTLGFLSYPLFLFFGYGSVQIFSAKLPLAAITSGLIMLTWYWFSILYFNHRKRVQTTSALELFDAALVALLVSSLGAWGVSTTQLIPGIDRILPAALTSFFLNVFTEGWAVIAILGVLWSALDIKKPPISMSWFFAPVLFGSMLIFPLGFSKSIISSEMLIASRTGLLLITVGLCINLWHLLKTVCRPYGFALLSVFLFLGLKIIAQFAAILPVNVWLGDHGLYILYLHLMLLGFISVTLIRFLPVTNKPNRYISNFFAATVWILLCSLVWISGYWPASLAVTNVFIWVFIIALLPVVPAIILYLKSLNSLDYG